tara:strand:- start:1863 stop:2219 length:357 start_codon:yes stop_codon:yes gene_type:complete
MTLIKTVSFFYLFLISIALLIPLDFFLVTEFVEPDNHPSSKTALIIHFVLFFFLYAIFNFSFQNNYKVILFCISYAVMIETMQIFTSRGFQILDIIFNLLGVFFSFLSLLYFRKKSYS